MVSFLTYPILVCPSLHRHAGLVNPMHIQIKPSLIPVHIRTKAWHKADFLKPKALNFKAKHGFMKHILAITTSKSGSYFLKLVLFEIGTF